MAEIVSIEKVLNSRCSCDLDNYHRANHWGVFLKDKFPSPEKLETVIQCCNKTPKLSGQKLVSWFENGCLFTGFRKANDPLKVRLLHIQSGMQQEAVYLACTALGLGACIHNIGINGTEYGNKIATARHLILEKEDPYVTGKFSTAAPGPEKPFKKGKNLSEPKRNGNVECLPELEQLTLFKNTGTQADETDISQLLWAAKGRTPHYIKSHPWGLTIPTMGGGQNYTTVYLVKENKLFRYINWTIFRYINWKTKSFPWWIAGNPTHNIKFLKKVDISSQLDGANTGIILTRNEETNRALWEVGYMLENMLLQTKSLGISYKSKAFTKEEIRKLERKGISEAVAALLL